MQDRNATRCFDFKVLCYCNPKLSSNNDERLILDSTQILLCAHE